MAKRFLGAAAALLLAACAPYDDPTDGDSPREALEVAALAFDVFYDDLGYYPEPLSLEEAGIPDPILDRWEFEIRFGDYGYCIQVDAEDGTAWRVMRDDEAPTQGECPRRNRRGR